MGKLNKSGCFIIVMITYALLISQAFCARVRLLDAHISTQGLESVLSQKSFQVLSNPVAGYQYRNAVEQQGVLEDSDKNDVGQVKERLRVPGKQDSGYRYLVLNLLPKGSVPPSGPSKRTNNLDN